MSEPLDIVCRPIVTEKNMHRVEKRGEYTFEVAKTANKIEIRHAVEKLFNVKVVDVRTITKKGLTKRVGWRHAKRPDVKKAIVKLGEGYKIEIL